MSIKVLVADDSITIQKVIGIIFGGDEYSLTIVDNGKAAVDKAHEINPDILLIDALMPGMTGFEVAEAVRSTPSLAAKPILILTGSFEAFDEEKAKKSGADDFISKPFESQQIIAKVKALLELGASREAASFISPPQHGLEMFSEQAPEVTAAVFVAPDSIHQPEVSQPAVPDDIWGAFTPEVETSVEPNVTTADSATSAVEFEPDVFAIVTEENDAQLLNTSVPANISPQHTGSKWVPVEENTFEFEEETVAVPPLRTLTEQMVPDQESSFGDIAFENNTTTPGTPVFSPVQDPEFTVSAPDLADIATQLPTYEESTALESKTFTEIPTPVVSTRPDSLTEEQLKAAISNASKEIIQRIVWEVVPDLAEALIREAIRKIKAEA